VSTPTVIATLRVNLLAAIKDVFSAPAVLSAIGGKVPFLAEGKTKEAWFVMNLQDGEGVVMSYAGNPLDARGPLGQRGKDRLLYRFEIALCSGDWAVPVGAIYKAADLGEYLKGSPTLPLTTPNLRTAVIGNIGGNDIYVRYVGEDPKMAPNSTFAGGRSALVQTWESDPRVPM
jgi:hypothetical protein